MTLNHNTRHHARPARREAATHIFAVGEIVRIRGGLAKTAETYQVTARLPARGDELQYRIRNNDERHERVTTQGNLEAIGAEPASGAETLIERTFGLGHTTAALTATR